VLNLLNMLNRDKPNEEQIWTARTQQHTYSFLTENNPQDYLIKYATLLTALAPTQAEDILAKLMELNKSRKQLAIQFLIDLKKMAREARDHQSHFSIQFQCFLVFSEALSILQDELLESLDTNSFNRSFKNRIASISQYKPPFLVWVFFFMLLGSASLINWYKPDIFSSGIGDTETLLTTDSGNQNSVDPNIFFPELLYQYESLHQIDKKVQSLTENLTTPEITISQKIDTDLEEYGNMILQIFTSEQNKENEEDKENVEEMSFLEKLQSENTQHVINAREEGFYQAFIKLIPLELAIEGNHNLKNLSENDRLEVEMLQKSLSRRGYYKLNATGQQEYKPGIVDPNTKNAVKKAQADYNKSKTEDEKIDEDGELGPETWEALTNTSINRIKDLQVEIVYETLEKHLKDNPRSNIIAIIKQCRDRHKENKPLHFNDCLNQITTSK
ncbi:peptidoglycan-binding domain-containing protein, partial [Roseofilum casamattae]